LTQTSLDLRSPAAAPLTVTALNERARDALLPLRDLRVQGEVSGARYSGGHLYFDLKDGVAKVAVRVWRQSLQRVALQVRDGLLIVCSGRVDLWVQGGQYTFVAHALELAGQGALLEALQRLKQKLEAEGLFAAERKVPLPYLPQTVGLVTALGGAALRDMLRVLHDRFPVQVRVVAAKVQGEGAAESLAQGIELLDRSGLSDVIVVGRGGGSAEDLWAFNEERLVRAVAACQTPIVSAVGHETDVLLTDFAADWRAPTPTAAAERVVPRWQDLAFAVSQARDRLEAAARRLAKQERRVIAQLLARLGDGGELTGYRRQNVDGLTVRLDRATAGLLARRRRRLDQARHRLLAAHPVRRLGRQQQRLAGLQVRLLAAGKAVCGLRRAGLDRCSSVLRALDPRAALQRGFAFVKRKDSGAALQSVAGVAVGEGVELIVRDGRIDARIERVRPDQ
jgi:exodeoxyribonuclease VII large subunit